MLFLSQDASLQLVTSLPQSRDPAVCAGDQLKRCISGKNNMADEKGRIFQVVCIYWESLPENESREVQEYWKHVLV